MRTTSLWFLVAAFFPLLVSARVYTPDILPYSDQAPDLATDIAVGVLTDEDIVQGNPDGTFRYDALLNRAEFTKIAMGLVPDDGGDYTKQCFPDVSTDVWYAEPVCRAKALGIVSGNALPGLAMDQWPFAPERNVQYEEALKILVEIFELPLPESQHLTQWYMPYLLSAQDHGVALVEDRPAGYRLRRGDMARLVVAFMAQADGELEVLRAAEAGLEPELEDDSILQADELDLEVDELNDTELEEEEGAEASEESSSSEAATATYDTNADVPLHQNFLLLGSESPVIGSAKVFSETQPLIVDDIVVRMNGTTPSVSLLNIFDHDGVFMGTAYKSSSTGVEEYVLSLPDDALTIEKAEEFSFYARAMMKHEDAGGVSGDVVEVQKMGVEGDGGFNSKRQSAFTNEDYPAFQSARSIITEISNPGSSSDVLISGQQIRLGSFRFKGVTGDGGADLAVTDLTVNIDLTGGVTVQNVQLGADGLTDRTPCAIAGSVITCSSIPESFGSFEDIPRILTLYGDVDVPASATSAHLQLRINNPGSVLSPGSVTWTDGTTSFQWVPGDTPVVRSTLFEL